MTTKTKYWTFIQNNSGGYFVQDHENGVCEYVIVEACTAKDAIAKLEKIGTNVDGFWSYCVCCGERWYTRLDDSDGTVDPQIYGKGVYEETSIAFRQKAYIHRIDGTVKLVTLKDEAIKL